MFMRPLLISLAFIVAGCVAPQSPGTPASPRQEAQQPTAPKRVTIHALGDAQFLNFDIQVSSPNDDQIQELLNRGLTEADPTGVFRPIMAEAVPSIENGLWKVSPDGRMETTWKIKPDARWHDGTAYTSEDMVFTIKASMDTDLGLRQRPAYASIESAEAPDPRTVTVKWKQPFIDADTLFSFELALPLPRHLLEKAATGDKTNFGNLPYWTDEFVGTGPFKLREFVQSSHILLQANDLYILGRPKIDEIEIKVLPDPNALMASVLAGAVDLVLARGVDADRAAVLEEQWKDGRIDTRVSGSSSIFAQFVNRSPAVVGEAQFRRALLHAIDRPQLADVLVGGRTPIAHSFLGPNEPEFKDVESALVRYDYDPRRAAQLIEGLGYSKGPDGTYRDPASQRLVIELRADPGETAQKSALAVADFWQQVGVGIETVAIPNQRARDLEYIHTFPAFLLRGHTSRMRSGVLKYHSRGAPRPENRWVGDNVGRYASPELDATIDRYFVTIPPRERTQVLQATLRHITDQVPVLTLFYTPQFAVIASRIQNMQPAKASGGASKTWDAHLWAVNPMG